METTQMYRQGEQCSNQNCKRLMGGPVKYCPYCGTAKLPLPTPTEVDVSATPIQEPIP